MKYNHKSIYALNKADKDAIVYTESNQRIIRLTRANFDTEADFLFWKQWSDENYHKEEKSDHVEANHKKSMSEFPDIAGAVESPEIVIEQRIENLEKERYTAETVIRIKGHLTEKQFRRLWMYCVGGLTQQQIADAEAVGQQRISVSISSAIKRIKKLLSVGGDK